MSIDLIALNAKKASHEMAKSNSIKKNNALKYAISHLQNDQRNILEQNLKDIQQAEKKGLNPQLIDRLSLQKRFEELIAEVENIIRLPDPIGEFYEEQTLEDDLTVKKLRVPIGVIGVIYESRPNVTVDVSALSIKSGNCAILRGGSEALNTNLALIKSIQKGLAQADLPATSIQILMTSERTEVLKMLKMHEYIDMIIPRGGFSLHQFCRENSTIPVITGGMGICHLFVDETADVARAVEVVVNAKTQRPTVCNALDTLLIHQNIAERFLPMVFKALQDYQVEFRLDPRCLKWIEPQSFNSYKIAQLEDWKTEWLSLILGVKIVNSLHEAIQHIIKNSTGHSDGILTQNEKNALTFVQEVDSAAVYVNASTRFTDGGQLGLGSEVAISTQKLHARGPMGLKELTTYKWIVHGNYSVRR